MKPRHGPFRLTRALAGRWESTPKEWKPVDLLKPAGRWCLVAWCSYCKRAMRDYGTEGCLMNAKWPAFEHGTLRNNRWTHAHDLCADCDSKPKVTHVAQCGACKRFKEYSPFGVYHRFNSYVCSAFNIGDKQCVSCWNGYRHQAKLFEEADAARLFVNRIKRKINEASKVNA